MPAELAFAINLGIQETESIRVLAVRRIPLPLPNFLLRLAERWQLGCPDPAGMALGRGIYAVETWSENFALISHELVHVLQYQRMGGQWAFLRQYLWECAYHGYEASPMEVEARERSGA